MSSARRELPFCLSVRPAVLVAAARGAALRPDSYALEVVRAIRDHRDDLSDEIVLELLRVIEASPAQFRSIWAPALRELRRPSLTQRARTRAARAQQATR